MSVFERPASSPSPFWFMKFTHLGEKVRRSTGERIGVARELREKMSEKKQASLPCYVAALDVERRAKQEIETRQKGKFEKGTVGDGMQLYFSDKVLGGGAVLRALKTNPKLDPEKLAVVRNFHSAERRVFASFKSDRLMDSIEDHEIVTWGKRMRETGKKVSVAGQGAGAKSVLREGLTIGSANAYLRFLSAVLNYAHDKKQTARVPAIAWIADPLKAEEEVKALEHDEVEKVCAAARAIHVRYERVLRFAFNTGARKTEMFALPWGKVDYKSNGPCRIDFTVNTKRGRLRNLEVPDSIRTMLIEMRREQLDAGYTGDKVFAFQRENGVWEEPKSMNYAVPIIQQNSGVPEWTMHVCRHTYASRLLRHCGASLSEVSILLGHKDTKTTEIYASFCPTNLSKITARLDQFNQPGGAPYARAA